MCLRHPFILKFPLVAFLLVTVDTTPPVKGWIKDGDTPDVDILYTSDPATVATHWDGFSDPESQLKDFELEVYRKRKGMADDAHKYAH